MTAALPYRYLVFFLLLLLATTRAMPQHSNALPTMLMVSDVHFNPFHDPAKVVELARSPAKDWETILGRKDSPSQASGFQELSKACGLRGIDTPYSLFSSAVRAMHRDAGDAAMIIFTGDALAHRFDCMYEKTQPGATAEQYSAFTAKTIEYVLLQLHSAAPGAKLYFALGNNDSDCGDYKLSEDEPWFDILGKVAAAGMSGAWTEEAARNFRHGGYYNVKMSSPMRHTRMIAINDMFLASGYKNCKGEGNRDSSEKQMVWLQTQLDEARANHESVWIIGHIPPGVSTFATFIQQIKKRNLCTAEGKANTYMPTERLSEILEKNADVIKLAVFGHTHLDELKLVEGPNRTAFPLKITPALTTVGGNQPSFTVARIDVDAAQIADYTVISAPDKEGHTWSKEYTFSESYGYKGLTAESVRSLIADLRKDPGLESKKSQDYVLHWSVGAVRNQVQPAWLGYVCSMDKLNPAAYKQCVCEGPLGPFLR